MDKKIKNSIEILSLEKVLPECDGIPLEQDFSLRGIYTLGLVSSPKYITVISQQRRALALANCVNNIYLSKKNIDSDDFKIAIIGGGIAGVSLAISLIKLNKHKKFKVYLFEQANSLCHLQKSCHTKRLHPNIHLWPKDDWDIKESNLGIDDLNWASDTSSKMVEGLLKNFYKILEDTDEDNYEGLLNAYVGCSDVLISSRGNDQFFLSVSGTNIKGELAVNQKYTTGIENVDLIFLSTGFGIERNLSENALIKSNIFPNSYWRNDSFSQTNLIRNDHRFLISGNGDGAIVELFRLLIDGYSQDHSLNKILPTKLDDIGNLKSHPGINYPDGLLRRFKNILEKLGVNFDEEEPGVVNNELKKIRTKESKSEEETNLLQSVDELLEDIDNYKKTKDNLQKLYLDFIEELKLFKDKEGDESIKLFDWLERYFLNDQRSNDGALFSFIVGLISPKLIDQNKVVFLITSEFLYKNKIEAIVENPRITFYNRILFYFVWAAGDFEILYYRTNPIGDSSFRELLDIVYKYNIPKENIIIRHGADLLEPINKLMRDSGIVVDLENIFKKKKSFTSELSNKYRIDNVDYLKNLI